MRPDLARCAGTLLLVLLSGAGACRSYVTEAELERRGIEEDGADPAGTVGESAARANEEEAYRDVLDDANR